MATKNGKKKNDKLDVACTFGKYSPGEETDSIALHISPEAIGLDGAEQFLCGAQLDAVLIMDSHAKDDAAGQETFDKSTTLPVICEVHGYRRTLKSIGTKLSFPASAVDDDKLATLCRAGKTEGRFRARKLGPAEEKKRGRPKQEEADDPHQLKIADGA